MALPPEKVKIKRKKDEDPVEALYIAPEDDDENPKKRRHTEFIFRRLRAGGDAHSQNRVISSGRVDNRHQRPDRVPQIHTTLPGEGDLLDVQDDRSLLYNLLAEERKRDIPIRNKDRPGGSTTIGLQKPEVQRPSPSNASNPGPPKNLQPRRFHLSKSSPVTPFPRSPVSGVLKRKKGALKNEVAIFVEKERRLKRPRSLLNLVTAAASFQLDPVQRKERASGISKEIVRVEDVEMSGRDITSGSTPRKRPLISTKEKQRLIEQSRLVAAHQRHSPETQKTAQTIHADPKLWDYDSPHLAAELQEVVLHSINTQVQSPLKYKPKAPPTRLHERAAAGKAVGTANNSNDADVTMHSSDDSDDEDAYVYDTYIREPRPLAPELDPNNNGEKVGVLVIKPEDREEWEAFADDGGDDSDKDFNSDDEDENAESFYANDYPEDEVDSEDEYNRGAYERFRTGNASDQEEFDAASWSGGDEGQGKGYEWLRREGKGEGAGERAEDEEMS
ncbi:MAG: hypothetical protein M1839_006722 [Geoglossum umbratile]|nr:MAG: hypothetical protein M1839_006722 [Geoglossum umbratile]